MLTQVFIAGCVLLGLAGAATLTLEPQDGYGQWALHTFLLIVFIISFGAVLVQIAPDMSWCNFETKMTSVDGKVDSELCRQL